MLRTAVLFLMLTAAPALAQSREGFGPGPVLPDVGPIAPVDSDLALPKAPSSRSPSTSRQRLRPAR